MISFIQKCGVMHILFNRINFVESIRVYSIAEEISVIPCELIRGINNLQLQKEMVVKEMKNGSFHRLTEIVRCSLVRLCWYYTNYLIRNGLTFAQCIP